MLNRPESGITQSEFTAATYRGENRDDAVIDLDQLFAAVRRQFSLVFAAALVGIIGAVAYIATAQPKYTATAQILIDDQGRAIEDRSALSAGYDPAKIDSQVELLKSEKIGLAVVKKLDLVNNPKFAESSPSIFGRTIRAVMSLLDWQSWIGMPVDLPVESAEQKLRSAIESLSENVEVSRLGRTYVLDISYTSPDIDAAVEIANAFADQYLVDQLEAKYDATRRASAWLQERIAELKTQSLESDLAVQRFKAENNLIAADGRLVSDQQLSEVNSQLIVARGQTAQAEARYMRIQRIIDSGEADAAVSEALDNPVIGRLRTQYLETSKRYAEISQKVGPGHGQAINLEKELEEYRRLIFDELRRIAESYQSDYDIARSREETFEKSLAGLVGQTAITNEVLVGLRELEREAETYRNLYQTFLQRYQETVQRQSFPITEARVITQASAPDKPSHPKTVLVLAIGLLFGGTVGAGFGALREYRERGFRTGKQIRESLGLEFLGYLPAVRSRSVRKRRAGKGKGADIIDDLKYSHASRSILRQVIDTPLSGFAETLRSARVAADLVLGGKRPKIIGVVSAFAGEGKSTVAKNFASLLGKLGSPTLLIDCDLRNPGLTRGVAAEAQNGLLEVLFDGLPVEEAFLTEVDSSLKILPAVYQEELTHTSEVLSSPEMRKLIQDLGESFDYIVIDLPPIVPVVDARAMSDQIDAFLMVVEWGKTPKGTILSALSSDPWIREKILGIVLNKVDLKKQGLYENYHMDGYSYSRYHKYYHN